MKQPLAVYPQGPRSALGDLMTLPIVALVIHLVSRWHATSYLWPSLLPAEPGELANVLFFAIGVVWCTLWLRRRLQKVYLHDAGLELCYLGSRQMVPWDDLRWVAQARGRLVLHTAAGTVKLPADLRRADALADAILERLGEWPAGRVIDAGPGARWPNLLLSLVGLLPLLFLAPWFDSHLPYPSWSAIDASLAAWAVAFALLGQVLVIRYVLLRRRVAWLEIGAEGLRIQPRVGPPRDLPWAALREAVAEPGGLRLRCFGADYLLPLDVARARSAREAIAPWLAASGDDDAEVFERTRSSELLDAVAPWLGLLVFALVTRRIAAGIAVLGLGWTETETVLWLGVAAGGLAAFAWAMSLRAERVIATADGLRIEYHRRARMVPWTRLRRIERRRGLWLLRTETGLVRFAGELRCAEDLLARAEVAIERCRAAEPMAERVESGEIEKWLGIEPDDVLEVRAMRARQLIVGACCWFAAAVWLLLVLPTARHAGLGDGRAALFTAFSGVTAPAWLFWLLYYPVHLVLKIRADALRRVYATGHGLRWHEGPVWSEVGWDLVANAELVPRQHRKALFYWTPAQVEADREMLVECGELRLRFHPTDHNAPRLQQALDHLMAARRAGRLMPKLSEVPAAAISRAKPDEAAVAERGISRV